MADTGSPADAGRRAIYRYTVEGSRQYCVFERVEDLLDALREDLASMDRDERYIVGSGEMTDAELAALPDFEGF